jgi:putative transposase
MIVTRTEQIQFKSDEISVLAHASKNLYNAANYLIRKRFFENDKLYRETKHRGEYLWYKELYPMIKDTNEYKQLPAQTAQHILKFLVENWKSYFKWHSKWLKEWLKAPYLNPDAKGEPKIPKYKKKCGENILIFTNQQCRIIDGVLYFPARTNLSIKTRLQNANVKRKGIKETDLREVRIIPRNDNYICEIVYNKEVSPEELDSSKVIGIDLGVNNIVTIGNNFGEKPIVVKGGIVKSINQYYNKKKAKLSSVYDKQKIKYGGKLSKLDFNRNNKIKDYFHKLSRFVVNHAREHKVKTIIIGKNDGWKLEVNLGKLNNQKFVSIPFSRLIKMIQYKAEELGIDVITTEESYTSKCSFLDNESLCKHESYLGKRIKRGLFRSSNGTLINADLNGAYNIIRKVIPEAFEGIEGIGLYPKRRLITSFKCV